MSLNILIVDDSATVRSVVRKALRLAELPLNNVVEAANGAEALRMLREQWIDLVLTDINMPEMNGLELIDAMKKDSLLASIPIVVISTEGSATRIEETKQAGVNAYLRKPFHPEQIKEIVEEVLGVQHV